MMKEALQGLSQRQAMLLLILFLLEGESDLPLLRFLPDEEVYLLEDRAHQLSSTPRKQLLPHIVGEIKRLIRQSNQPVYMTLDPEWLSDLLLQESPRVIQSTLQMMPRQAAERVVHLLPSNRLQQLSSRGAALPGDLQRWLQFLLSKNMPEMIEGEATQLDMASLVFMSREDLLEVMRELGFREMAIAFRSSGKGPLTEVCRRLGHNDAFRLLSTIEEIGESDADRVKEAQRTIRSAAQHASSKTEVIEGAGMFLFQSALAPESSELSQQIAYKLPRKLGKRLLSAPPSRMEPDTIHTLQGRLLNTIQSLGATQSISSSWGNLQIVM